MKKLTVIKGELYEEYTGPLTKGWRKIEDTKLCDINEAETVRWTGGKIAFRVWAQVVAFMKWSQETFKSEAHCSLFYNKRTGEWRAWAFPQETMGMTVRLLEGHPNYREQRRQFDSEWILAGSVHHHCESGAFQSGTDSADEANKDGIHVTIGHTSNKLVDLHARKSFDGVVRECSMGEFFEGPAWYEAMPDWAKAAIKNPLVSPDPEEFPEVWKTNVQRSQPQIHLFQTASASRGIGQTTLLAQALAAGGKTKHHPPYHPTQPHCGQLSDQLDAVAEFMKESSVVLGASEGALAEMWIDAIEGKAKDLDDVEKAMVDYLKLGLEKTGLRNKTIRAFLKTYGGSPNKE